MIIHLTRDDDHRAVLRIQLEEYDATPVTDHLTLGFGPQRVNNDRLAIASYLAFGLYASGNLQLAAEVSPSVAEAIEADAATVPVRVAPVVYAPRTLPAGDTPVTVQWTGKQQDAESPNITVIPDLEARGSLRHGASVFVASNAYVLDALSPGTSSAFVARLAVAVLFAEDLDAKQLQVATDATPDAALAARLRALLQSVNLDLVFLTA